MATYRNGNQQVAYRNGIAQVAYRNGELVIGAAEIISNHVLVAELIEFGPGPLASFLGYYVRGPVLGSLTPDTLPPNGETITRLYDDFTNDPDIGTSFVIRVSGEYSETVRAYKSIEVVGVSTRTWEDADGYFYEPNSDTTEIFYFQNPMGFVDGITYDVIFTI